MDVIQRYRNWLRLTTASVLVLIVIGGTVRASGSGLGCPDWPRCFGRWVPPISESQLPPNYQTQYATHGYGVTPFNPLRTWTEYLNRVAGVSVGILFLGLMIQAWRIRHVDASQWKWATLGTGLVGFEGWLGAQVVASVLAPVVVTIHMVGALVILSILVIQAYRLRVLTAADIRPMVRPHFFEAWRLGLGVAIVALILLGTQVREAIDTISDNLSIPLPPNWTQLVGWPLDLHKWIGIAVFLAILIFARQLLDSNPTHDRIAKKVKWIVAVMVVQLVIGFVFLLLAVPGLIQPIHLGFAALLYVLLLDLLLS